MARFLSTLALLVLLPGAPASADCHTGTKSEAWQYYSKHLGGDVVVLPGVFTPREAEGKVLPFMKENTERFRGARVLDIGTGSGIIATYAARLGAAAVVATDIDASALETAKQNAARFGVAEIVEPRLVPPDDLSAYSVIQPGESFDVIISNPPFSLDLDAGENTPLTDTGDLGLSIIRGLAAHLRPDGVAILYYNSTFYHHVMIKYAEYEGYRVRNHSPKTLTPWEAATLFNSYLARLLVREGIDPAAFAFDHTERSVQLRNPLPPQQPLLPGNSSALHQGMMVIQHKPKGKAPGR